MTFLPPLRRNLGTWGKVCGSAEASLLIEFPKKSRLLNTSVLEDGLKGVATFGRVTRGELVFSSRNFSRNRGFWTVKIMGVWDFAEDGSFFD